MSLLTRWIVSLFVLTMLFLSGGSAHADGPEKAGADGAEQAAKHRAAEEKPNACEALKSEVSRLCRDRLLRSFTKVNCRSMVKAYVDIAWQRLQPGGGDEVALEKKCQGWVDQIRKGYARHAGTMRPEEEAPEACKALAPKLEEKCIQKMDEGRLSMGCDMALTFLSGRGERELGRRCASAAKVLK